MNQNKHMVPGWMRSTIGQLGDQLDGVHDRCVVAAAVNMGMEGFTDATVEQSNDLADANYGPMMLASYNHLSGLGLLQAMRTSHRLVCDPQHESRAVGGDNPGGQQQRFNQLKALHLEWLEDWLAICMATVLRDQANRQAWWIQQQAADSTDQQPQIDLAAIRYVMHNARLLLPEQVEAIKQQAAKGESDGQ